MSTSIKVFLSFLLLATTVYGGVVGYRIWRMVEESKVPPSSRLNLRPARPLAEFEFTERSGKKVGLKELEGKIFVVNFFWANCNYSCRALNEAVGKMQQEFKDTDIQFVSVTVEPHVDTPERLKTYADTMKAPPDKWWFVNAPMQETQDFGTALKVNVTAQSHTNSLIVIDRAGKIRGAFDFQQADKLKACRKLLNELVAEPVPTKPAADAPAPSASASATASATAAAAATSATAKGT